MAQAFEPCGAHRSRIDFGATPNWPRNDPRSTSNRARPTNSTPDRHQIDTDRPGSTPGRPRRDPTPTLGRPQADPGCTQDKLQDGFLRRPSIPARPEIDPKTTPNPPWGGTMPNRGPRITQSAFRNTMIPPPQVAPRWLKSGHTWSHVARIRGCPGQSWPMLGNIGPIWARFRSTHCRF